MLFSVMVLFSDIYYLVLPVFKTQNEALKNLGLVYQKIFEKAYA